MKAARVNALEQSLALMRAPALLATLRQRPLPDDVLTLLRLAAGDEELVKRTAAAAGETREHLVESAVFYIQQVLFAPGSDSYRVLGANPDAADAKIKENYRWLVKWLHPDRNTDDWDAIYADRVNRAWQDLRSADRRGEYDVVRSRSSGEPLEPGPGDYPVRHPAMLPDEPMLSSRAVRRLPVLVFAGLGLLATMVLGLLWYAQQVSAPDYIAFDDAPDEQVAPRAAAPESDPARMEPVAAPPTPLPLPGAEPAPEPEAVAPVALPSDNTMGAPGMASAAEPVAAPAPDPELIEREVQRRLAVALARAERELRAAAPGMAVTRGEQDEERAAPAPRRPVARPRQSDVQAELPRTAPEPVAASPSPAPGDAAAAEPAAATEPPLINDVIAADLLLRFRDAYARGDLERMMALFSPSARNNRGGIDAIRQDYRDLFEASESRQLLVSNTNWLAVGDTATILTSFEAVVVPVGRAKARRVRGDIRFDLRRDNGTLRIVRLLHDNAEG